MNKEFLDAIEANPIIAAVKDEQGLQNCLGREELTVIFILYGDIRSTVSYTHLTLPTKRIV